MIDPVSNLVSKIIPGPTGTFMKQTLENMIAVYAYSFLALLIVSPKLDIDALQIAATSALLPLFTAAKGLLASRYGDLGTTSFVSAKPAVVEEIKSEIVEKEVLAELAENLPDVELNVGPVEIKKSRRKVKIEE